MQNINEGLNERTISYSLLQNEMQTLVNTFNSVSVPGTGRVELLEKAMAHVMRAKLYLLIDIEEENAMIRARQAAQPSYVPPADPVVPAETAESVETVVEEQPVEVEEHHDETPHVEEHHSEAIEKFNARQAKTEAIKEGGFTPVRLGKHKCGRKPGSSNKGPTIRITTDRTSSVNGPHDFGSRFLTFNNSKDIKYRIDIIAFDEFHCAKAKFPYKNWETIGKTKKLDSGVEKCREHFREYLRLTTALKENDKIQNEK